MEASGIFDDEAVRILLMGTEDEVAQGLTRIHQTLRGGVCGLVRQRFPGLSPEDLADLWAEVLTNLWDLVRGGTFDGDRELLPLVCELARRRAVDIVRRQGAGERLVTAVGEALRATKTGADWGGMPVEERAEVMEQIRAAVGTLPPKQRTVMEAFVDDYPDTADMQTLRMLVSERTGVQETLAAVKRALQEARAKVRGRLRDHGYDVGEGDAS